MILQHGDQLRNSGFCFGPHLLQRCLGPITIRRLQLTNERGKELFRHIADPAQSNKGDSLNTWTWVFGQSRKINHGILLFWPKAMKKGFASGNDIARRSIIETCSVEPSCVSSYECDERTDDLDVHRPRSQQRAVCRSANSGTGIMRGEN